jgi:hypothetical protein
LPLPTDLRISVIVPAYNATTTISAALRSALDQELAPIEVIVVDDGSQDGTADFVAKEFPAVRLVRQANAGPSAARNAAADLAQGEWLAFLDADDLWLPQKLRLQAAALQTAPGMGMCSTSWVRDLAQAPKEFPAQDIPTHRYTWSDILRLNRFQTSTALVRKDLYARVGGFRPEIDGTEDWDFCLRRDASHAEDAGPSGWPDQCGADAPTRRVARRALLLRLLAPAPRGRSALRAAPRARGRIRLADGQVGAPRVLAVHPRARGATRHALGGSARAL